jgi:group I intron endonuclease
VLVYKITNLINGKIYIGQTKKKVSRRFNEHTRTQYPIGQALRKYGEENFKIEVLVQCPDVEYSDYVEVELIKAYNCVAPNGYNLASGGKYFEHCDETKRKLSEKAKERGINPELTKLAAKVTTGVPRTEEVKRKISEAQKGKKLSESHLENLRASMKNKKQRCDIKEVYCTTLGIAFDSAKEAAEMLNIKPQTIRRVCSGARNKTQCGLVFEYI